MPKSSWASSKAMRGKCERRGGSVNVAAAGTNVIRRAMGARRGRLSAPWLQFHGAGRADVYIIIRVRASRCGESALNPPPSQPIPVEDLLPPPHSDTPSPSTSAPHAAPTHAHAAPTHARRLRDPFPADLTTHSPPKLSARPRTATRPSRALPLPHAAPTHARRLCDAFPADPTIHSPQRHAASPSVPLRAQKNGTAQCMCDAECLGRPSLRSVIWVGEPRAVRHRCGALACRRGA